MEISEKLPRQEDYEKKRKKLLRAELFGLPIPFILLGILDLKFLPALNLSQPIYWTIQLIIVCGLCFVYNTLTARLTDFLMCNSSLKITGQTIRSMLKDRRNFQLSRLYYEFLKPLFYLVILYCLFLTVPVIATGITNSFFIPYGPRYSLINLLGELFFYTEIIAIAALWFVLLVLPLLLCPITFTLFKGIAIAALPEGVSNSVISTRFLWKKNLAVCFLDVAICFLDGLLIFIWILLGYSERADSFLLQLIPVLIVYLNMVWCQTFVYLLLESCVYKDRSGKKSEPDTGSKTENQDEEPHMKTGADWTVALR